MTVAPISGSFSAGSVTVPVTVMFCAARVKLTADSRRSTISLVKCFLHIFAKCFGGKERRIDLRESGKLVIREGKEA